MLSSHTSGSALGSTSPSVSQRKPQADSQGLDLRRPDKCARQNALVWHVRECCLVGQTVLANDVFGHVPMMQSPQDMPELLKLPKYLARTTHGHSSRRQTAEASELRTLDKTRWHPRISLASRSAGSKAHSSFYRHSSEAHTNKQGACGGGLPGSTARASTARGTCQLAAPTRSDASRSCGLPVCSLFVVFVDKEI
eukprot:m.127779 g.127779  ORF g.127779 m.127779 type:complete len:196 (-) comp52274_c0_seq1:19-606(-)